VLGKRLTGTAAATADSGNTGDGAMGAVTVGTAAKPGKYRLVIIEPATDAGQFSVEDPDGVPLASGTVAVAYSAGGLSFTLADGATDFAAGDAFTIEVTLSAEKYLQLDPSASTGEEVAAGILYRDTTAPDGSDVKAAVVTRDAEVNAAELVWPAGITAAETALATLQLKNQGIVLR